MDPTNPMQQLIDEHRVIERVLTSLAAYGMAVQRGEPVDPEQLPTFVTFLRDYADTIHHGKEEQLVFAAAAAASVSPALAPRLAASHRDCDTARLLIDDLAVLAKGAGQWSDRDRERLVQAIGDYVSLLRRHIHNEDTGVFPGTWAAMPEPMRQKVAAAWARFDADHTQRAAELCVLADRLADC